MSGKAKPRSKKVLIVDADFRTAQRLAMLLEDDGFEVEVSDRGPGVPEALRDVIFDRGVTSRAADHSGLGLFSAKQLAQRLGGDLRVEAARRGGARFVAHFGTRGGHRGA